MIRLVRSRLVFVLVTLMAAQTAGAQQDERARRLDQQIDRIFQANEYTLPRFGPARWLADGTAYTTVERSPEPAKGSDIVRYDAATGARSILIAGSRLVPEDGTPKPEDGTPRGGALQIADYVWSDDGTRLLVFTNTRKVWRQNTRGDYWVLDLKSGGLRKIGGAAPASSLMFAKFSPDGTRVGYVRANNIYVERIDDGRITQLTSDGSETTINGTSDWVYEEELGVRDGFRWSPDGRSIAYWQFDSTGVGIFSLINNTDALYPTITRIPYPKAGTTNSAARIGVVSADGGDTTWIRTDGDPRNTYLARLSWIDANTVAIQQLNRLQNRNDFLTSDVRTGEVKRVFRDESKTWVDVVDEVLWIDGGRTFLWMSERDGWQHVYRVPREGGDGQLVTKFDADVTDVAGVDEEGGWLYFVASPQNAGQRYLYRSKLDGSGTPERLTPAAQAGTHRYTVAPGGRLAFHTYSRFDLPPVTDVVELPGHTPLRTLTDTAAVVAKLAPVLARPVEFFTIGIGDGVVLDGWMLKPPDFDPVKRYPVIAHVYGEPAGQTVNDSWGGGTGLFHRALAEAGYVVLSVDNRGTPAPRGADWRKVVYGTVGDLSSRDQAAAMRALVAAYPYLDRDRIGVWGWSGGGTNTLNAMFRFPEIYRVGVAVAPVPDQRLYDTIYQERYMGLPQDNVAGYKVGSAINFAEGLHGKLLVIHGSGDDNVHAQGTEKLINRLIELGKPFDSMVYPNRTHAIAEGPGTTPHVYKLIARYFLQHLSPGGV
ncbi:MAG: peptidase S9 [Acidobacteria bacterium RIFCSPLOWO2_12_FULL_67_14b]|nr:MAG: peptidase S9 [Acidobacteria bacterium RIFCSPLOWO2_12_FULL_67_14b]